MIYFSKISRYTPSDNTKVFDKAVQRGNVPNFDPKATIEIINKERSTNAELSESEKFQLLQQYLDVSALCPKRNSIAYRSILMVSFITCSLNN